MAKEKVLRLHGDATLAADVVDAPYAASVGHPIQSGSYRTAVLPGEYFFPLSISMDIIRGLQQGNLNDADPNLIVPGISERAEGEDHLWVQFSPVDDQLEWYTIQPKTTVNARVDNGTPILTIPLAQAPFKMPSVFVEETSQVSFTSFNFVSLKWPDQSSAPVHIKSLFPEANPSTRFKIRIIAYANADGYDEYAIKNISISSQSIRQPLHRDNQHARYQIPRSDTSYSWINASAVRVPDLSTNTSIIDFRGFESSDPFSKKIGFVDDHLAAYDSVLSPIDSDGGPSNGGFTVEKYVEWFPFPSTYLDMANLEGQGVYYEGGIPGNDHSDILRLDFLGLNSVIAETIDIRNNTLDTSIEILDSWTTNRDGVDGMYVDISAINNSLFTKTVTDSLGTYSVPYATLFDDKDPKAYVLNSLILNRQGPYGWPSFKQIRGADHILARVHRKTSTLTMATNRPIFITQKLADQLNEGERILYASDASKVESFRQPYVDITSPTKILEVKNPNYSVLFEDSFLNRNTYFSTSRLNKALSRTKILPSRVSYGEFTYIDFKQRVFPVSVNVGIKEFRERENATFPSWRNNDFYRSQPIRLYKLVKGEKEYLHTRAPSFSVPSPMNSIDPARTLFSGGFNKATPWLLDGHPAYRLIETGYESYLSQSPLEGLPWVAQIAMYKDSHEIPAASLSIEDINTQVFRKSHHLDLDQLGSVRTSRASAPGSANTGVLMGNERINFTKKRKNITNIGDFLNLDSASDASQNFLEQLPKISYSFSKPIFKTMRDVIHPVDPVLATKIEQASESIENRLSTEDYISPLRLYFKQDENLGPGFGKWHLVAASTLPNPTPDDYILSQINGSHVDKDYDPNHSSPNGDQLIYTFVPPDQLPGTAVGSYHMIYDSNGVLIAKLYNDNVPNRLDAYIYVDQQGHVSDEWGNRIKKSLNYHLSFADRKIVDSNGTISEADRKQYCFTNMLSGNDQRWTAHLDHPVGGPNYDSYSEYSKDLKPLAKDYSILPEFRIHNFIDEIITSNLPPAKSVRSQGRSGTNFLEIPETIETSRMTSTDEQAVRELRYNIGKTAAPLSSDAADVLVSQPTGTSNTSSFYREYTTTELIKMFDLLDSENIDATTRKIKLKARGIKKFLPYSGFYPAERTAALATHFASSYYGSFESISGEDGQLAYAPWMEALLSPGILFNTIKSGIAVDYPIFTKPYKIASVSPYVVNHRQVGLSPTDYEYDVAPIAIAGQNTYTGYRRTESGVPLINSFPNLRKKSYDDVNASPYKPKVGIGFVDPPIHDFISSFDFPSRMVTKRHYLRNAVGYYNSESHSDGGRWNKQERDSNYGALLSCGNMYSPYYYKKYYSDEERSLRTGDPSSLHTDYSGSFASPLRYALGGYTSDSKGFDYRIPFEAIVDPEVIPKNLECISSHGWHQEGYLDTRSRMSTAKNKRYTMAASNFFAESMKFFLKDGRPTSLSSKPDSDADFGLVEIPKKGYQYRMRFVVVSDPTELANLKQETGQDYLDVVSGLEVKYHTGPAYQFSESETPNETFKKFLLSYFDKWDYKKGITYSGIKEYHNFSDVEMLGLNFDFSNGNNLYRTIPQFDMFWSDHGFNGRKYLVDGDQLVAGDDTRGAALGNEPYRYRDTQAATYSPSINWFRASKRVDWETGNYDSYRSMNSYLKGPFNISPYVSSSDPLAGGFEFFIFQEPYGYAKAGANPTGFEDARYWGSVGSLLHPNESHAQAAYDWEDQGFVTYTAPTAGGPRNADNFYISDTIFCPSSQTYSFLSTNPVKPGGFFHNVRNVYIETDEAFWISPPTSFEALMSYSHNQLVPHLLASAEEQQDRVYPNEAPFRQDPTETRVPFGIPNILTKALSMKGLRYQKMADNEWEEENGGLIAADEINPTYFADSVGATVGSVLDTNDLYAPLYQYTPFNINLGYYFGKAGSEITTNSRPRLEYHRKQFVFYNNKSAFGHPCVSIEGWNTLHFPQFPQNFATNNTARIYPDRSPWSYGNTTEDYNSIRLAESEKYVSAYNNLWIDTEFSANDNLAGPAQNYAVNGKQLLTSTHGSIPGELIRRMIVGMNMANLDVYHPGSTYSMSSAPWYLDQFPYYRDMNQMRQNRFNLYTGDFDMFIDTLYDEELEDVFALRYPGMSVTHADFDSLGNDTKEAIVRAMTSETLHAYRFDLGNYYPSLERFRYYNSLSSYRASGPVDTHVNYPARSIAGVHSDVNLSFVFNTTSAYWHYPESPNGTAHHFLTQANLTGVGSVRKYATNDVVQTFAEGTITPATLTYGRYGSVTPGVQITNNRGVSKQVYSKQDRFFLNRYKRLDLANQSILSYFSTPGPAGIADSQVPHNGPDFWPDVVDLKWLYDYYLTSQIDERPRVRIRQTPALPVSSDEVEARNNTLYDDHYYVGFMEPIVSYDYRPYTPPHYEGYCYAEYVFTPSRAGKHTLAEIFENTHVQFYRKRDRIKYANVLETETYLPNYWHRHHRPELNEPEVEEYKFLLNPLNLQEKKLGEPQPNYARVFPDIVSSNTIGNIHAATAGTDRRDIFDTYGSVFGVPEASVSALLPSEYRKVLQSRSPHQSEDSYMKLNKGYDTTSDIELISYLPNRLKVPTRPMIIPVKTAGITTPTVQSYYEDNESWQVSNGDSADYAIGEHEFLFAGDTVEVQDNFSKLMAGTQAFSTEFFDPYASDVSKTVPLEEAFPVGAEVVFYCYNWSSANLIADHFTSSHAGPNAAPDVTSDLPVFAPKVSADKLFVFSTKVKSVDLATRKVTFSNELGSWNTMANILKKIEFLGQPGVTDNNLITMFEHKTGEISNHGTMIVFPPTRSESFGDYGYVPRFCGLEYPESQGFLVNESTWNRLNPMEAKSPLFYDGSEFNYHHRPITFSEAGNPNLGHFYDEVSLSTEGPLVFISGEPDDPDAFPKTVGQFRETVVNWKVCPNLTTSDWPGYLQFKGTQYVSAISRGLQQADRNSATLTDMMGFKTSGRYEVLSPTSQGPTSYLFYRYNNRVDSRDSLNHISEMDVSASFNLFGATNVENLEFDSTGQLQVKKTDSNMGSRWVISSKFETPALNFAKWTERRNRHIIKITIPDFEPDEIVRLYDRNGLIYTTFPKLKFHVHGPAVGITDAFKVEVDVEDGTNNMGLSYFTTPGVIPALSDEQKALNQQIVRRDVADKVVVALQQKLGVLNSADHFRLAGGLDWSSATVSREGNEVVVITGPEIDPDTTNYNKGKFKIVNARIPMGMKNGRYYPQTFADSPNADPSLPAWEFLVPGPVAESHFHPPARDEVSFLDIEISQECGEYVYADRVEPKNYKRRDSDIIPDPVIGMWHQEGQIPEDSEGPAMLILDSGSETIASSPAEAVVSVRAVTFAIGAGISLRTHDGNEEKYTHINGNASNTGEILSDPDLENMLVVGLDIDGTSSSLATRWSEQAAQRIVNAINQFSRNFRAKRRSSEVVIETKLTSSLANLSEITVQNATSTGTEYLKLEKKFSGAGTGLSKYGSLADLVGFRKNSLKPIGRIAETKTVKEAVLAIPFNRFAGQNFVKIERSHVEAILENKETPEMQIPDSLKKMVKMLQNYVLPPHLDFITDKTIEPFLVFVLEFEHIFSKQDLADIWQNLYPRDSEKIEILDSEFEHDLSDFPRFELTEQTRWLIFKVKQKAEKSYFNNVDRSIRDIADSLKGTDIDSIAVREEEPDYSYNWPYDYFSLIELFKVDAEINMTNGEIPTFEEYMELSKQLGDVTSSSPEQLVARVENAAARSQKFEEEQARKEEIARQRAAKERAERDRLERARRPRTIQRVIYRNPEGQPYIVMPDATRIPLSVDSEGNYFYIAVSNDRGEERIAQRKERNSYRVVVIPTAIYNGEGTTRTTASNRRKTTRRKSRKKTPEGL